MTPLKLFAGARPVGGRRGAVRDVLAGVTLASMNIPQLLGYARVAAMPLVAGLYTALLAPVAFAMFGCSRHLVVAADSGTAAILAGALTLMAPPGSVVATLGGRRLAPRLPVSLVLVRQPVRWLVVEADAITNIDYPAARVVLLLIAELARQKVGIAFARVSASLRADMDRHGVTAALGTNKLFVSRHEALATVGCTR